jgi:ABC-type phosphate/phosphonate transport system substrate-binding protein
MPNMQSFFSLRNLAISLAVLVCLLDIVALYAEPVLRISAIIDEPPSDIKRNMQLLAGHLEKKIGMRVEYRPKRNGAALVQSLRYKELDLVWIDSVRLALARADGHDEILSIVQRGGDGFVLPASVSVLPDRTYSWVIREGLDAELRLKLTDVFLTMGTDSSK